MATVITEQEKLDRQARLKGAVKKVDGWWATSFTSKFSIRVVSAVEATSVTPNHITLVALLFAMAAAGLIYLATPVSFIVAAIFIQVAFALDCADGQLARFRQQFSDLGGFYDQIADRVREFLLLLSLVWAYHRMTGDDSIWLIGFLAFFFLYMLEYYGQQNRQIPSPADIGSKDSRTQATGAEEFDALEGRLDRIFPIAAFRMGEQLLIISLFLLASGIWGLMGSPLAMPAIKWLIITLALLGGAHAFYRPVRRLRAYYNWQRRGASQISEAADEVESSA